MAEKKTTTAKKTTKAAKAATEEKKPETAAAAPAEVILKNVPEAEEKKTFSETDVQAMIAKAVADALAANAQQTPQTSQDGVVTIAFMAEVSKDNVLELPGYGILRPSSYLEIPKKEFGGKFMTQLARQLIDKRHVLVLNGLTQDERVRWNCDYKDGEVLDEYLFDHLLDLPTSKICDIYERLCAEHRKFVVRRFITAQEKHDNRLSIEKLKALNAVSRRVDAGTKEGAFMLVLRLVAKDAIGEESVV